MRQLLVVIALTGSLATLVHLTAKEAITVSVFPEVTTARGSAQLRVIVERNELNRELTWEVDGPSYYRSSTAQLDGADSPRSYLFLLNRLPEGEFAVRATVSRANRSQSMAECRITVLPGGGP